MAGEKTNGPVNQSQHGISTSVGGVGFGHGNPDMHRAMPQQPYIRPKKELITQTGVKGVGNDEC